MPQFEASFRISGTIADDWRRLIAQPGEAHQHLRPVLVSTGDGLLVLITTHAGDVDEAGRSLQRALTEGLAAAELDGWDGSLVGVRDIEELGG